MLHKETKKQYNKHHKPTATKRKLKMQKQMTKQEQIEQMWAQREAQTVKQKEQDWAKAERAMRK